LSVGLIIRSAAL